MSTIVILGLIVILAIGFIRFTKEKNQETPTPVAENPIEVKEEVYQTTQEADNSYYAEAYPQEEVKEEAPAPKAKKTTKKSTTPKKESTPKKPAAKKTTTKKSTK